MDQVMTATGLWSKEEKQSTEGPAWHLGHKPLEVESPSHIQLPPSPVSSSHSFDHGHENVVAINVEELYPTQDEKGQDSAETQFEDTGYPSPESDQSMHDAVERVPNHGDAEPLMAWTEKNERVRSTCSIGFQRKRCVNINARQ